MIRSILNRFKNTLPFKDFYSSWITTLKITLLPPLNKSLSSTSPPPDPLLLQPHVDLLFSHFSTYFSALDSASSSSVSLLLFPPWRTSLEKPFLWLGDFHPYIFTNLLRSFLECDDSDDSSTGSDPDSGISPWKNLDGSLGHKVEQIECGLRLMVPALAGRAREAQRKVVGAVADRWKERSEEVVEEVVEEVMEEMMCVFLDANRLRRSVLGDILGVLNVYQSAFFLQGLAKFYVGFWDNKLIDQFKMSSLIED